MSKTTPKLYLEPLTLIASAMNLKRASKKIKNQEKIRISLMRTKPSTLFQTVQSIKVNGKISKDMDTECKCGQMVPATKASGK